MSLPKFDFSNVSLDDDQLTEELSKNTQREEKFFKPGKHEVQIVASTYKGLAEADETWGKVVVTYEGTGGKKINDMILIPFRDVVYRKGEEVSHFPIRRLKEFLGGIGVELKVNTLASTMKTYFGKDDALVGMTLAIEVGYRGNHTKYLGKNDAGEPVIGLVNRNGDRLENTPTFGDYKSANEYAEQNSIPISRFVDVLKYELSSTPAKKAANW